MKLFGKSNSTSEVEDKETRGPEEMNVQPETAEKEEEQQGGFWMLIEEAFNLKDSEGCVVVGRVAGTSVHKNQKIIVRRQSGEDIETTVDEIEIFQEGMQESVEPGNMVGIKLNHVKKEEITKGDRLMSSLSESYLNKIKDAEKLYVLYLSKTSLPVVIMNCAEVFTTLDYANNGLAHYKENYPELEVKEIPKEGCELTAGLPLFWYLTYLGIEEVVVDDGVAGVMVSRSELAGEEEKTYQEEEEECVTNTGLRMQMNSFIGQLENKVPYEGSEQVIRGLEQGVIDGIKSGLFLMASQEEDAVALLSDHEGNRFVPVFTDRLEFEKLFTDGQWSKRVSTFKEVAAVASNCKGTVINPLGENMSLSNEMLQRLFEAEN